VRMPPPVPLVPRALRLGVRERVAADGRVTLPLASRSLEAALRTLARAKVDAVAVCYLHAYRNPRHERLTARALARRLRGVYVSLSSLVLPQIKEYERVWTTVVNAYVGPALARYLNALRTRLAARGYRGDVLIMQSHGGVAPIRESARLAAGAVLSGPAGGIAAGRYAARLLDHGASLGRRERRHPEGDVLEHFGEDPAEAVEDCRSERGLVRQPEDRLRHLALYHRLHDDAVDVRVRCRGASIFHQASVCRPYRGLGVDAHRDQTEVGLVRDVG